jgi:hypothetical protein
MANTSRVNGLRPIRYLNGSPYNGAFNTYFLPSGNGTATFVGDLVKADATADTAAAGGLAKGIQSVIQSAAGDASIGVIVGFAIDPTNLNTPQYRAASTGRYVYVADDPNLLFEIQTSNGTLVVADVGLNADVAVAAGSTTTGASGMTLDVGTKLTTAALVLKIMGFTQRPDNDNTAASSRVVVKINNHQLGAATGTAGV